MPVELALWGEGGGQVWVRGPRGVECWGCSWGPLLTSLHGPLA